MIKVALPNKGQLFEPTMDILAACGYKVSKSLRSLSTLDKENGVEFFFLRPGDIPMYVSNGILDAGITGMDFVEEKNIVFTQTFERLNQEENYLKSSKEIGKPTKLIALNYGNSKLCAAVPEESRFRKINDLKRSRIATSFPNIVGKFFENEVQLVELEGAVEISIKLGIADAIVDIVETGTTLKQAGLRIIGEPLFRSQAALFAHPGRENQEEVLILKNRLEGKLLAMEYVMVEYDVPEAILKQACIITPGIESPTVTSLQKAGWFSVKAMIKKRESQKIMDELSKLGCKGILLTSIDSVRI